MASGGYREPSNPAPVSNPGAGSARTDGGPVHAAEALSSGKYGETQDLGSIAGGAPSQPSAGSVALAGAIQGQSTFADASGQPNEPVTAGAQYGPGPGPEALQANDPTRAEAKQLQQSGVLALMMKVADSDDATPDYRAYVRSLLAALA